MNESNNKLIQTVNQTKQYERELGIRFDVNSHQLSNCKQQYELEIEHFKEKCAQLEYKIAFEVERREKDKIEHEQEINQLNTTIQELERRAKQGVNHNDEEENVKLRQKILEQKERFR